MPETVNELNTTKEECIEKFRNATFGEEVRGALIDLANLVYTDVINAALSGLKKGDSITNVSIQNGDLILEITSYDIDSDTSTVTTKNLGNIKGPTGQDGPMGPQGNSITAVNVDSDGDLYVTIGSGTPTLIGNVKGPKGDTGATGPKGDSGDVGPEHEWTVDGSLSPTSMNPVQNRAIYNELQGKQDKLSPNDVNEITIVGNRGQIKASGRTINYESTLNPVSYNSVPTEGTVASYTYSKTESDARFAGQTALNNYYNKNESDTKYLSKNDANNNYYTKSQSDNKYLTEHQDISGKQNKLSPNSAGKVTVVGNNGAIKATNFSIDDIEISELASQTITTHDKVANYTYSKTESDNTFIKKTQIDEDLDTTSENPVQNQVIANKFNEILENYDAPDATLDVNSTHAIQNQVVARALNEKLNIGDFNDTIFDDIDLVFSNTNGGIYYDGDCPSAPALFIEAYESDSVYTYFLSYVDSLYDSDDNPHWHRIANITYLFENIINIDNVLDNESRNPVKNSVITNALNKKYEYKVISLPFNNISGLNDYTDEDKIYIVNCNFQPIAGKAHVIFVKSTSNPIAQNLFPYSAQFIFSQSGRMFSRVTDGSGAFQNLIEFNMGLQVDNALSATSENPVQNKVIKAAIDEVISHGVIVDDHISTSSINPVQNRVISNELDQRELTSNKDDSFSDATSDTYDRTHYPSIKCLKDTQINIIPSYVRNEADRVTSVAANHQGSRTFNIGMISDMHIYSDHYPEDTATDTYYNYYAVRHACQGLERISKSIHLNAFAILGDYIYGNQSMGYTDGVVKINRLTSNIDSDRDIRLIGNHDYGFRVDQGYDPSFVYPFVTAYNAGMVMGDIVKGYGYYDNEEFKLRIIALNTTEYDGTGAPASEYNISTAQKIWFANALDMSSKSDAASWQILILSHHPLDWNDANTAAETDAVSILKAYKNGSTVTISSITIDFANKNSAIIIGNIHGHLHNYLSGTIYGTNYKRWCCPSACFDSTNRYYNVWRESTTYSKTIRSAEDTAFAIFSINLDNHTLSRIHYGAGYDTLDEVYYASGYTNVVPTSIDTDGTIFNGIGYADGYRVSSNGSPSAYSGSVATGYIPVVKGDIIRFKGVDWNVTDTGSEHSGKCYLIECDDSFNVIGSFRNDKQTITKNGDIYTYTVGHATSVYIRLNGIGSGENLIVTVNEEIND